MIPSHVRVDREEGSVLRQPERQGVHAHAAGTFPLMAARVIADALQVEDTLPQVPDRVAAIEQRLVADSLSQQGVKIGDDFSVGSAAV